MIHSGKTMHKGTIEDQLKTIFKENDEFVCKNVVIDDQHCRAYYLRTLVDLPSTMTLINRSQTTVGDGSTLSVTLPVIADNGEIKLQDLQRHILRGQLILFRLDGECVIIDPASYPLSRSVEASQTENPLQSSFNAFTEDIDTNIGLLRKKVVSMDLIVDSLSSGTRTSRKLAVVYMRGTAKAQVVQQITDKLKQNNGKEINNVRDLLNLLGQPKLLILPTHLSTEVLEESVQNLLQGKVLILMDQYSFAFIFPAVITDLWSFKSDINYSYLYQLFFRFIRIFGLMFALVTPGLYIVLNSVNPELLRIQLALSVAKSRDGVPYPSLVEMVLTLLLVELVVEATIRLPKNIGPAITMAGGIIIGEALVQAKLVSNLLIIILNGSMIANFSIVGYLNTIGIRFYKYVIVLASAFCGIWGLEAAIVWLGLYLAGMSTFSVPYLSTNVKGNGSNE